jgi:hypothetical protein
MSASVSEKLYRIEYNAQTAFPAIKQHMIRRDDREVARVVCFFSVIFSFVDMGFTETDAIYDENELILLCTRKLLRYLYFKF